MAKKMGKSGLARAVFGAVMAYVIFLQALGGAIAGSHHPGRATGLPDALFVLCTSEGRQTAQTGQHLPEDPSRQAPDCCEWGCGSVPAALEQPPRGSVAAWEQAAFLASAFAIDESLPLPWRLALHSNPARAPPYLRM